VALKDGDGQLVG